MKQKIIGSLLSAGVIFSSSHALTVEDPFNMVNNNILSSVEIAGDQIRGAVDAAFYLDQMKNEIEKKIYSQFGGAGPYAKKAVDRCVGKLNLPSFSLAGNLSALMPCGLSEALAYTKLDQALSIRSTLGSFIDDYIKQKGKVKESTDIMKESLKSFGRVVKDSIAANEEENKSKKEDNSNVTSNNDTPNSSNSHAYKENDKKIHSSKVDKTISTFSENKVNSQTEITSQLAGIKSQQDLESAKKKALNYLKKGKMTNSDLEEYKKEFGLSLTDAINIFNLVDSKKDEVRDSNIVYIPYGKVIQSGYDNQSGLIETSIRSEGGGLSYIKAKEDLLYMIDQTIELYKDSEKQVKNSSEKVATNDIKNNLKYLENLKVVVGSTGATPAISAYVANLYANASLSAMISNANRQNKEGTTEPNPMTDSQKLSNAVLQTKAITQQLLFLTKSVEESGKAINATSNKGLEKISLDIVNQTAEIVALKRAIENLNLSIREGLGLVVKAIVDNNKNDK